MPGRLDKGRGYMRKTRRKTSSKKKASYNKNQAQLVRLIKRVNLKQSETKYITTSFSWGALTHDNIYHKNLWSSSATVFPGQGTTDGTRIGDRIMCQGIKLRAHFDVPWDRKNVKLKLFYIQYNSDQGDPTDYGSFFHDVSGNSRLDPIQKKRWGNVVYLGEYQIEPERAPYYTYSSGDQTPAADVISSNTGTIFVKKWLPMNKAVYFKADASTVPTNLKEYGSILAIPYGSKNTSAGAGPIPGDNLILSGEMTATVYFKDL